MADLMKTLSELHAVSGNEQAVRAVIKDAVRDTADGVTVDTMGNVIAFKKGKNSGGACAVTVNMDEAGLIIGKITDKGYLKLKTVGDIDPRTLVSKRIVTERGEKGVIGMKAIHLQTRDERDKVVKVKDLFADIGAADKADAEKRVRLGEYVTFDTEFGRIGNNVKGKALGRSALCTALINVLKSDCPHDFYAVFTAQHEVGARGAYIAAHRVGAKNVLTLCETAADDMYGAKDSAVKLGGGIILSLADKTSMADRTLTERLADEAQRSGIKAKKGVTIPNCSDGGAAQVFGAAVVNAALPCRYPRSPVSVMCMDDIREAEKFIELYLRTI